MAERSGGFIDTRVTIGRDRGDERPDDEQPFFVALLADLSGDRVKPLPAVTERSLQPIDRSNFAQTLKKISPALRLVVPNTLAPGGGVLGVWLQFSEFDDWEPDRLLVQVPLSAAALEVRKKLEFGATNATLAEDLDALAARSAEHASVVAALREGMSGPTPPSGATGEAAPPTPPPPPAASGGDLLSQLLGTAPAKTVEKPKTSKFMEAVVAQALAAQGGPSGKRGNVGDWLAELDRRLDRFLSAILHSPSFQRLEATWRSLRKLLWESDSSSSTRFFVLNLTVAELTADLALPQQSRLHQLLFTETILRSGATPYDLILVDHVFEPTPTDFTLLHQVARLGARCYAPVIAGADFGLTADPAWSSFRRSAAAASVGLFGPPLLGRLPYGKATRAIEEYPFTESTGEKDYLWLNPAWGVLGLVDRAIAESGWPMNITGIEDGKLSDLPSHRVTAAEVSVGPLKEYLNLTQANTLVEQGVMVFLGKVGAPEVFLADSRSCAPSPRDGDGSAELHYQWCAGPIVRGLLALAYRFIGRGTEFAEAALNRWLGEEMGDVVAGGQVTLTPTDDASHTLQVQVRLRFEGGTTPLIRATFTL